MLPLLEEVAPGYRIEKKFYISLEEADALKRRLDLIMRRDPHCDARRHYTVYSVYLDDREDHSLLATLLGAEKRKKYRIRSYNGSDSYICLECKMKRENLSYKTSLPITRAVYDAILQNNPSPLLTYRHDLAKQLYFDIRTKFYRPRSVVKYEREIFIHPIQQVRITLDTHLAGSVTSCDMFVPQHFFPILPRDIVLLEVKYNHFLPEFIARLLPHDMMPATANCKYAHARALTDRSFL